MSEEYTEEVSSESTDDTSVIEESASQADPNEAEPIEAAQEEQEEKPAPFHEHPRFKELIEQNRAFKEASEKQAQDFYRLQGQLDAYQRQQQAPVKKEEPPVDQFLQDLEKVNPAYAKSLKSVYEKAAKAEQIEQRLQQYEQQQFAQKAYSHFDSLLASNKVEGDMAKEVYKAAVEAEVFRREQRGEKLGLNDLDKIFNSFHGKYAKYNEERERAITAQYSTAKKADRTPAGATGGNATSPTMKKFSSMDSPEAIKWMADELRKSKKI